MLECLLASKEELVAWIRASQGKVEVEIKTGLEEVKATELEANPEVKRLTEKREPAQEGIEAMEEH
jgi:hypothetical protein